jgi:hypothetical protein
MKEPKRIPLTDNPRVKEPKRLPLTTSYPEPISDDLWEKHETQNSPPIFSKTNENNRQNDPTSIQELESDKTN